MKRLAFAILGTAALLLSSSLYAQRGMSGRGGGGFSGGAGFRSGGSGGFRSAPSGFRSAPGGFRSAPGSFRSGPGVRTFSPGRTGGLSAFAPAHTFSSRPFVPGHHNFGFNRGFGFHHFHHNHFGFFDACFGCFSPFFGAGLFWGPPFYPSYYGDYYPDYYGAPAAQPVVVNSDNGNSVALAAEVQRLTDEVGDLRDEENRRYYEDRARAANSGASMTAKEPAAATVFVFRDGRRISTQSYAITGQTLWIFDEHAARKYQISDLDAASTEKANAANGVEFHVPAPPAPR
jgi:hypothetical protein